MAGFVTQALSPWGTAILSWVMQVLPIISRLYTLSRKPSVTIPAASMEAQSPSIISFFVIVGSGSKRINSGRTTSIRDVFWPWYSLISPMSARSPWLLNTYPMG